MLLDSQKPLMAQFLTAPEHEKSGADLLIVLGMMFGAVREEISYGAGKTLILFTSDRKKEAEDIYHSDPKKYALIHSTPMGELLERLAVFDSLPGDVAYLGWYLCAAQLIEKNKPAEVLIVANPENELSTLWNFELPLLLRVAPQAKVRMVDQDALLERGELEGLCKSHFLDYLASHGVRGKLAEKWALSGYDCFEDDGEHVRTRALLIARVSQYMAPCF